MILRDLIAAYRAEPASPYHEVRYRVRENYDSILKRLDAEYGTVELSDIRAPVVRRWHLKWTGNGVSMAHSFMVMLRILFSFGVTFVEDDDCERLSVVMSKLKFKQGKPREQHLTAAQATAIRVQAHAAGWPSMALQQALQFDGTLRQKDTIGEWIPSSEPGESDVRSPRYGKNVRGARWEEIDRALVFRHITSKREKLVEIDLKDAPMVVEELSRMWPGCLTRRFPPTGDDTGELIPYRDLLPARGPIIVDEDTGLPYLTHKFRRRWRDLARAAGIPDDVQNRDSRAGAITEAIDAGASLEDARKTATHSTTQMTARYSRGDADAIRKTMKARAAHRVVVA